MCWFCDHPNAKLGEYLAHVRDIIEDYGWFVQGVSRDGPHPPWSYTVGLTEAGRPELVVTGLGLNRAHDLLNMVAAHVMHGTAPRPGERIPLIDGPMIEIVRVAEPAAHLKTAVEVYGAGIQALQLVHADDRGHWPWDVGYRSAQGAQPVLGVRTSKSASGRLIAT